MDTDRAEPITLVQMEMCLRALGWTIRQFADRAELSTWTIVKFNNNTEPVRRSTLEKMREAFEKGGIEFLGNVGIRYPKSERSILADIADLVKPCAEDEQLTIEITRTVNGKTEFFLAGQIDRLLQPERKPE